MALRVVMSVSAAVILLFIAMPGWILSQAEIAAGALLAG
jgi:hypothetical protein